MSLAHEVHITEVDNRDSDTTWLWINDYEYIEVSINSLVENARENLPEEEDTTVPIYSYPDEMAPLLQTTLQESLHQDLEGWEEHEKQVIRRYLKDIDVAVNASLECAPQPIQLKDLL